MTNGTLPPEICNGPRTPGARIASGWRHLDPRRHLGAAVGWAVFAVVMVAAIASGQLVAREAERQARRSAEQLLTQFAAQIQHGLAQGVATRQSILLASAMQIAVASDRGDVAVRRHLQAVRAQFPELAWLAVADAHGRVTAATSDALAGQQVAQQVWFAQGRQGRFVADKPVADAAAQPVVVLAVPIQAADGRVVGVLGAGLSWAWVERLQAALLQGLDPARSLQAVLLAGDGTVLLGQPGWAGQALPGGRVPPQPERYLSGQRAQPQAPLAEPAWSVLIRQDAATALAPARAAGRLVFSIVLLTGLLAAALAMLACRRLLRRLVALAEQARALRRGERTQLDVPAGGDEVGAIALALSDAVAHLQREKLALQALNAELDARVLERTARMAEQTRLAEATRARLRLARELHDTLAHSLVALLTQIRLVRKLHGRMSAEQLDAELDEAQAVALRGLSETRATIAQMRQHDVNDVGLGAALQQLLTQLHARTGLRLDCAIDPQAAHLGGGHARLALRIAQEALSNIERHAHARCVRLRLHRGADTGGGSCIRLEIEDDGAGFDPQAPTPGHYGVQGMRERAALMGAQLDLNSRPGHGTRLVLHFGA
ncbi:MAG: histidine kinase [Pseudomonadota bacterium]|nr:histidine kinase [Pseudomonadota bacterium]